MVCPRAELSTWLNVEFGTAPASAPASGVQLKDDETIINPFYMRQLLQYAIRCAQEGRTDLSDEEQMEEAAVSDRQSRMLSFLRRRSQNSASFKNSNKYRQVHSGVHHRPLCSPATGDIY